jgi:hypothetical protein
MIYVLLTLLNLVFTGFAYVLAPVVALFCRADGWLPKWLAWFQTFDASLDAGWRDGYFPVTGTPTGRARWWLRTKWLWRNPAYGFCYWAIGINFVPADWEIVSFVRHDDGTCDFHARTKDGRYFNLMAATGTKLGWKAWNYFDGLDEAGQPKWKTSPWGPAWRTPICFTPGKGFFGALSRLRG